MVFRMQDDEPTVAGVEGVEAPGSVADSSGVDYPAERDVGERNWFAWLALSAVAVTLAVTIFALRPDEELTATGTDTTIVERDGDTTASSATLLPSTSAAPTSSIEPVPDDLADSFESRPTDGFITGVLVYDGGWLAFESGGLVWSANGLDWDPFATGISRWQLHDWSVVDGELLIMAALPTSTGDDELAQELEYSVWRVEANGELRRAAEYSIHRDDWDRWRPGTGTGASFGVLLSQDVEDRTRRAQIADFLSPWLTPAEFARTCRVLRAAVDTVDDSDGFVNAVEFRDCEEETIATVLTEDLGGDSTNELLDCLNSFVNPVVTQSRFVRLDPNIPPAIEQFELGKEVLFALATPDGSLVFSSDRSSRSDA